MSFKFVRSVINRAIQQEKLNGEFLAWIREHRKAAESGYRSCPDSPLKQVDFMSTYLEHTPELLTAVRTRGLRHGLTLMSVPVFNVAQSMVISSPLTGKKNDTFKGLVASAYMVHRFIEEVTDIVFTETGFRLVSTDLTRPNLIAHNILGDRFANQLETMVSQVVADLSLPDQCLHRHNFGLANYNQARAS